MPLIAFVWCMTQRLVLAIQDTLKDTFFVVVDGMISRIFYLYQKSPKKLKELKVDEKLFLLS